MIERACWLELGHAAQDRAHPWRVMTLATVDRDRADARSVVIRDVEEAARQLIFYTDARSAKVAQMHAHPRATLVGWWPKPGWQLRLSVTLSVQTSGLDVSSRWARVKLALGPGLPGRIAPGHAGGTLPARARFARALRGGHGADRRHGLAGTARERPPPRTAGRRRQHLADALKGPCPGPHLSARSSACAWPGTRPCPPSGRGCRTAHGTAGARSSARR